MSKCMNSPHPHDRAERAVVISDLHVSEFSVFISFGVLFVSSVARDRFQLVPTRANLWMLACVQRSRSLLRT